MKPLYLLATVALVGAPPISCLQPDLPILPGHPDPELLGVVWRLAGFGPPDGELSAVDPTGAFTLQFGDDGSLFGRQSCSTYCSGTYRTGLRNSIVMDLSGCYGIGADIPCLPSNVPAAASSLTTVRRYEVDGDRLRLYYVDRPSGAEGLLVYAATPIDEQ